MPLRPRATIAASRSGAPSAGRGAVALHHRRRGRSGSTPRRAGWDRRPRSRRGSRRRGWLSRRARAPSRASRRDRRRRCARPDATRGPMDAATSSSTPRRRASRRVHAPVRELVRERRTDAVGRARDQRPRPVVALGEAFIVATVSRQARYTMRTGPLLERARSIASARPSSGTDLPTSGVGSITPRLTRSMVSYQSSIDGPPPNWMLMPRCAPPPSGSRPARHRRRLQDPRRSRSCPRCRSHARRRRTCRSRSAFPASLTRSYTLVGRAPRDASPGGVRGRPRAGRRARRRRACARGRGRDAEKSAATIGRMPRCFSATTAERPIAPRPITSGTAFFPRRRRACSTSRPPSHRRARGARRQIVGQRARSPVEQEVLAEAAWRVGGHADDLHAAPPNSTGGDVTRVPIGSFCRCPAVRTTSAQNSCPITTSRRVGHAHPGAVGERDLGVVHA